MARHRRNKNTTKEVYNSVGTELVQMASAVMSMSAPLSNYGTIAYSTNNVLITLNYIMLSYLYANNGLFRKALKLPIDDALSKGIKINSSDLDEDDIKEIFKFMNRPKNNLWDAIRNFEAWRNLFGGAGLVINTGDEPDTEYTGIGQGEAFELYDADRWQLTMTDVLVNNMNMYDYNPDFAKEFNINGVKIDKSRVIIGKGSRAPWHIRNRLQGWGMSKAEQMIRDLNLYIKTQNVLYEILDESKIDVYHIKNLASALLSNRGSAVINRIQTANALKNFANALVLDAEEQFESKMHAFSGLAEVMNENRIGIAAALGIPMTKLFGLSPAGFSTGDSDLESYYQTVESEVREPLKPVICAVIDLVCQHLFGYVPLYEIEFPPLKQLSEKEQEEVSNLKTDRILKIYEQRLLTPKETMQMLKKEKLVDIETAVERGILPDGDQPGADKTIQIEHTNSANSAPIKRGRVLKLLCETKNSGDFKEDEHPRDNDGKFTAGDNGSKSDKKQPTEKARPESVEITDKNANEIKSRLRNKFNELAVPANDVSFSRENYDKLFPDGKIQTPVGEVKMGKHQFEKLERKDRQKLLGAVQQTLSDPLAVIRENNSEGESDVYYKTFSSGATKGIQSVVIDRDGLRISVTSHERDKNNVLNKIGLGNKLVYEKPTSVGATKPATGAESTNSAVNSNTQLLIVYHKL